MVRDELAPLLAGRRTKKEGHNWRAAAKALIAACGDKPIQALTAGDVRNAQESYRNRAPSTRRMVDYTIRRILATFIKEGAPDLTGVLSITPMPAARQVQPTQAELARLKQAPDLALRLLIHLCAEAGLRSGTAVTVRPADIIGGLIVTRTKKGAVTKTPISAGIQKLFALAPEDCDISTPYVELLAGRTWDNPLQELTKRWARWKRKCKVRAELRFHDLRRGLARRLYKVTGDVRAVQSLLSHRSPAATLWYLDASNRAVKPADLKAAIEEEDSL